MMHRIILVAGIAAVANAWQDGHVDTSRLGSVLKTMDAAAPTDCYQLCHSHADCKVWTWSNCSTSDFQTRTAATCTMSTTEAEVEYHPFRPAHCGISSGLKSAVDALLPLYYAPLPVGSIKVAGWLQSQLKIMANGLSGHLDLFWPDVNDSVWVGGKADHGGAGHERGPYWLNGMVPLAAQLNATGDADNLEIDINGQVNHWVSYILDHQLPSGWLGPDDGFGGKGNDYWSGWNTAASLLQYADAQGIATPMGKRCGKAVIDYIAEVNRRMAITPTTAWTQNRWQDWAYIIHWTLDQDPQGQQQMLWDAAVLTQQQSWDWDAYYAMTGVGTTGAYNGKPIPKFPKANVANWNMYDHGVNNAMGTKSCTVWYRHTQSAADKAAAYKKIQTQDMYQGQPHGMFSADECFGGRALNRGIELCAVVEQMYSLQHMFRVHGDVMFMDRQERIAFNSLPGTLTADMWQHQYLQQANEINALYGQTHHPWQTDGVNSTGFGVAPNFGCCTANYQQGWPKYVNNLMLVTNGVGDEQDSQTPVIAMLAPFTAAVAGTTVVVDTLYPFGDNATITVTGPAKPTGPTKPTKWIKLRIPGWASKATIAIDGAAATAAANGTVIRIPTSGTSTPTRIVLELNPEIVVETGWGITAGSVVAPPIDYTAAGATVLPTSADGNFTFTGGAGSGISKLKGASMDIRSGGPGTITSATLNSQIVGQGHFLETVAVSFRYITGYGTAPDADGPSMSLVLVDAASDTDVKTIYTSPVLNKYPFDKAGVYSPPINASAKGLHLPNGNVLKLVMRFTNNKQNLQIPVGPNHLVISLGWSASLSPQPPKKPFAPLATNAAAVTRGPLLFGITLKEKKQVVKTWAPFNNTDFDLTTDDKWNYALDLSKPMMFKWAPTGVPSMPFDHNSFPGAIMATARLVAGWNEEAGVNATNEPPPSPIECVADSCSNEMPVTLVPYGSTNLRISAMPWM